MSSPLPTGLQSSHPRFQRSSHSCRPRFQRGSHQVVPVPHFYHYFITAAAKSLLFPVRVQIMSADQLPKSLRCKMKYLKKLLVRGLSTATLLAASLFTAQTANAWHGPGFGFGGGTFTARGYGFGLNHHSFRPSVFNPAWNRSYASISFSSGFYGNHCWPRSTYFAAYASPVIYSGYWPGYYSTYYVPYCPPSYYFGSYYTPYVAPSTTVTSTADSQPARCHRARSVYQFPALLHQA